MSIFKKTGDNSFVFAEVPQVVMLRSTEEFWRKIESDETHYLNDTAGMPIEYSDGKQSWYPAVQIELFVNEEAKPVAKHAIVANSAPVINTEKAGQ